MLGDSPEFRRLRRAVGKAGGDRDLAIRNVCRLYGVKAPDALPAAIRAAALALLDATLSSPSQVRPLCPACRNRNREKSILRCANPRRTGRPIAS